MSNALKPGDHVEWNTSQGTTSGRVKKRLTSPRMIKGHKVAASPEHPEHPEYLVESSKSGKLAAHEAGGLKKTKSAR